MKIALVLSGWLAFWLSNCISLEQKKTDEDLAALWSPIIAYLNQKDVLEHHTFTDLRELYSRELSDLEQKWVKNPHNNNLALLKKHEFFYEQISMRNQDELSALNLYSVKDYQAIASLVIESVESHKTASSKKVYSYDQGGQIGFCFGRALLVHYLLLKAGVSNKDIVKVFALGDLALGGQFWHFHVAMAVKSSRGLIVVDPLYGEPASMNDWMSNIKSLEIKHPLSRARFFITDPRKFMPTSGIYAIKDMLQPELLAYFGDMIHNLP